MKSFGICKHGMITAFKCNKCESELTIADKVINKVFGGKYAKRPSKR